MLLHTASMQHQPQLAKPQPIFPELTAFLDVRHVSAVQVSCTTEFYQLEEAALPVMQRMPIKDYTCYRTTIQVRLIAVTVPYNSTYCIIAE